LSEQQESLSRGGHPRKRLAGLVPVIDFALHIFVGTAIFILIAMASVGLDLVLKKLENYDISNIILKGLTTAKIILFVVDLFLFLVFVANTGWRFIKSMDWNTKNERNNV
jgi:hypothetical protein